MAVGLIVATAVAGLAAPNGVKYFKFTATPVDSSGNTLASVAAEATNQVFLVKVTNSSPNGSSSNISSLLVTVPSQFTITNAALYCMGASSTSPSPCPAFDSNPNASTQVTPSQISGQAGSVSVITLDPIKRMQYVTVKITVTVTSSGLSCGSSPSDAWAVQAYTGSQLNGDSFVENPVNTTPTTTITKTCSLSFTVQPAADTTVNTAISPAVQVTLSDGASNVNVTISKATGSGTLSGTLTASTNGSGVASFSNLKLDAIGTYTLRASATGYGTATSNSFRVWDTIGTFTDGSCTTQVLDGGTTVDITAGAGGSCDTVPYKISVTADTIDFKKPATDGAHYQLTVTWGSTATYPDPGSIFDLDGDRTTTNDQFTPPLCVVSAGVPQYPMPDANGSFWQHTGDTSPYPWCVASSTTEPGPNGMQVRETFLGSNDPVVLH